MGFSIIEQNSRTFHHLSDVVVAEIVTKVNLIDRTVGNVTARMKEIARESGCSLNTVYRIYRSSLVTMAKDYDVINCRVPNYFIKVFANCFMKKSADCTTYMQKVPLARNFFD